MLTLQTLRRQRFEDVDTWVILLLIDGTWNTRHFFPSAGDFHNFEISAIFCLWRKVVAERYVWSSWTQKTLDRAVQGLSNGVQVVTHRLEMSRVIQVKLPCSEKCQHLDFAVERFILSSWTQKIETKTWRELSIDIKINEI